MKTISVRDLQKRIRSVMETAQKGIIFTTTKLLYGFMLQCRMPWEGERSPPLLNAVLGG